MAYPYDAAELRRRFRDDSREGLPNVLYRHLLSEHRTDLLSITDDAVLEALYAAVDAAWTRTGLFREGLAAAAKWLQAAELRRQFAAADAEAAAGATKAARRENRRRKRRPPGGGKVGPGGEA